MGQKVNPISFRLGFNKTWSSQWYADKKLFGEFLLEDIKLRKYIKEKFRHTGIPEIVISRRTPERVRLTIYTARPGLVIGQRGAEVDKLREQLEQIATRKVSIKIKEITRPELNGQLVSEQIAEQIARRVGYRRHGIGRNSYRRARGEDRNPRRYAGRLRLSDGSPYVWLARHGSRWGDWGQPRHPRIQALLRQRWHPSPTERRSRPCPPCC